MYPCLLSRVISDYLLIKKFQKKMTNVFSVLLALYGLHLIPYPVQGRSYSKKTVISFTIITLYLEQQLNVNHTVKLQWKVGHN